MMYILNAKERNQAFIKFLVLFLVTLTFIVGSIYFNFKIPLQLNESLQYEIAAKEVEYQKQQNFVTQMSEIKVLTDSLYNTRNPHQLDMELDAKLKELYASQESVDPVYKSMNATIVTTLLQLKEAINLRTEEVKKIDALTSKLEDCKKRPYELSRPEGN